MRLDRALRPGQTGCLRGGTYGSIHTLILLRKSGRHGHRITIRSFPGETALVRGWVDLEGSYTTLSRLKIDGSNTFYRQVRQDTHCPAPVSQALMIAGRNDILQYDDYFQSIASLRGNGIGIGFWGHPDNTIIRYSKIHDVGQCQAYDHLIYLSHGNNVRIYGNWLWNDPHGRAVQLYPAPTNARIYNNVVDQAGEGFVIGNEPGDTVSGNQIYRQHRHRTPRAGRRGHPPGGDPRHLYGGRPGTGNTFHNNDPSTTTRAGMGRLTAVRAWGNTHTRPPFIDAVQHDYALPRHSSLHRRHLGTKTHLKTP